MLVYAAIRLCSDLRGRGTNGAARTGVWPITAQSPRICRRPESRQPAAAASSSLLPLLGDEARKRGYVLPLPFGVSINYMDMRQNINVDSINFTGLSLDGRNIDCGKDPVCKHAVKNIFANGPVSLDNAFQIGVGHTRESSKNRDAQAGCLAAAVYERLWPGGAHRRGIQFRR
ncbi:lipoprotein [Klebsiella pneumoniae]|uniref:Lipoprotein n=1 Tax=Klebsiella pneumoniae TaxID=573 RepID=A0A3S4H9L4_KLEPN|nr:lipoprotein [Klebsiella pneumoniae]